MRTYFGEPLGGIYSPLWSMLLHMDQHVERVDTPNGVQSNGLSTGSCRLLGKQKYVKDGTMFKFCSNQNNVKNPRALFANLTHENLEPAQARTCLLLLLIVAADGALIIENPASSLLAGHDRFQYLVKLLGERDISTLLQLVSFKHFEVYDLSFPL